MTPLDFNRICAKLRQAPIPKMHQLLGRISRRNSPLLLELVNYQDRGRWNAPARVRSATNSTRYGRKSRQSQHSARGMRSAQTPRQTSGALIARARLTRLAALSIIASLLTGCMGLEQTDADIARQSLLAKQRKEELAAAQRGEVIFDPTPYYGSEVIAEKGRRNGKPLPKSAEGARSFILDGQRLTIKDLASQVTAQTGIDTQIRTKYITPTGDILEVPIGGTVNIKHEGTLSRALDKAARLLDVGWEYDGKVISFDRMVTRDHRISLPYGKNELKSDVSSLNEAAGSATMSRSFEALDPWSELMAALKVVAPKPAEVSGSPLAGRITVFGPPSVQAKATKVLREFEQTFATRVGLEIGVYFVDFDRSDEFGIGLVGDRTINGTTLAATGVAGSLTGNGIVTLSRAASDAISFKALASDSTVVDHKLASRIMQTGTGNTINLSNTQRYVAQTSNTTDSNGNVSTSVQTESVDDGLVIQVFPRLVANNKVQLYMHILENDLTRLETFETGSTTVQLPQVSRRTIPHELILTPGETTILSGYERERASRDNSGTGRPRFLGLGGTQNGARSKVMMVIAVRVGILASPGS